jgi:hypothetical protein
VKYDDVAAMTREERSIIFALGHMEKLKADGLLEGGIENLTDDGNKSFEIIKGFPSLQPTETEFIQAVQFIAKGER